MKINLERLEELKYELHGETEPHYDNHEPLGLQVIMEAVRGYLYNDHQNNEIITKLLKDYGVLVEEETEENDPFVKPHNFTNNG
jgi:hypothetical protein